MISSVMHVNQNRQDHEQEKSCPDIAQEKLERDRSVWQATLCIMARLRLHAHISNLTVADDSSLCQAID
jgi:hypothetical protein